MGEIMKILRKILLVFAFALSVCGQSLYSMDINQAEVNYDIVRSITEKISNKLESCVENREIFELEDLEERCGYGCSDLEFSLACKPLLSRFLRDFYFVDDKVRYYVLDITNAIQEELLVKGGYNELLSFLTSNYGHIVRSGLGIIDHDENNNAYISRYFKFFKYMFDNMRDYVIELLTDNWCASHTLYDRSSRVLYYKGNKERSALEYLLSMVILDRDCSPRRYAQDFPELFVFNRAVLPLISLVIQNMLKEQNSREFLMKVLHEHGFLSEPDESLPEGLKEARREFREWLEKEISAYLDLDLFERFNFVSSEQSAEKFGSERDRHRLTEIKCNNHVTTVPSLVMVLGGGLYKYKKD